MQFVLHYIVPYFIVIYINTVDRYNLLYYYVKILVQINPTFIFIL